MESPTFRAIVADTGGDQVHLNVRELTSEQLPAGDVEIAVQYSSINYKDAMAANGHRGIIASLPHVPGIDAAGIVVQSNVADYKTGDKVIVTGYDLGQKRWGAWSERIRVPVGWVVPLPLGMSLKDAMTWGTAGFTAAQCVEALVRNDVRPDSGPILVTGATGGVGSLSLRLLAKLGYEVFALSGKPEQTAALKSFGAAAVIMREEFSTNSDRPLLSARWAGGIDTVGGGVLTRLLRETKYGGCVAACGLVAGAELDMTLYPFLLRGVSLCGVASAECPYQHRTEIWKRLAGEWSLSNLNDYVTEVPLESVSEYVARMLAGTGVGRVIVRVGAN